MQEIEEKIEELSEEIHHLYCAQYLKDHGKPYWTEGDYSKLDERTKEYDRNIARFILADRTHHQAATVEALENKIVRILGSHESPHTGGNCRLCKVEAAFAAIRPQPKEN